MTPPAFTTLAFTVSSLMQVVHCAPAIVTVRATTPSTAEMTVRARAVCRSCARARTESWTLHCIWPVLWTTQDIHRPSQMVWATTMLESMNAVTFHIGSPHATITSSEPVTHSAKPRNSKHAVSMAPFFSGMILLRWEINCLFVSVSCQLSRVDGLCTLSVASCLWQRAL